jgi:two-component system, NarL family, response regulator DesR
MTRHAVNASAERQSVRVLVVDDHALFAEALMLTLGIDERICVVGAAGSGPEAIELAEALAPDVVLVDVHMPGMDGIEATRRLRKVSPGSRVLIVTASRSADLALDAFAAGAERFLTKDTSAFQIIDAIVAPPQMATVTELVPRTAQVAW